MRLLYILFILITFWALLFCAVAYGADLRQRAPEPSCAEQCQSKPTKFIWDELLFDKVTCLCETERGFISPTYVEFEDEIEKNMKPWREGSSRKP